jgi:hypothetical protein
MLEATGTAVVKQGGKALTPNELLNLSRIYGAEITQIELKNGGVALIKGTPGKTYFGPYGPSEILRHTHTHPGQLNLAISDLDLKQARFSVPGRNLF